VSLGVPACARGQRPPPLTSASAHRRRRTS
jgi:hypothetical protein